jgi:hypothetical protein
VNHLHAWELTDVAGSFADSGSSAFLVPLPAAGTGVLYGTPGIVGDCVQFGLDSLGASQSGRGTELIAAFSDLPAGDCTIEAWYNCFNSDIKNLFGVDQNGSANFTMDGGGSNRIEYVVRTGASFVAASSNATIQVIPFGWFHAANVYNSVTNKVLAYINGVQVATGNANGNIDWSSGVTPRMNIASSPQNAAGQFMGQISRCRLSNVARSQAYLQAVYKQGMAY